MTTVVPWEAKRTSESREVEDFLRQQFEHVDCYRYNSASLRIRVIDARFDGMNREQRDTIVEPFLKQLPDETQRDIITLLTFAPSDLERPPATFREFMRNVEFEDPSPSML